MGCYVTTPFCDFASRITKGGTKNRFSSRDKSRNFTASVFRSILDPHRTLEIVEEHLPGREGGDGLAKVLFERVVGELEGLLGAVGPEIAVHRAVHSLTVLVQSWNYDTFNEGHNFDS